MGQYTFYFGMIAGVGLTMGFDHFLGAKETYRRWYFMCRNALEEIDDPRGNKVLVEIGIRASKRESWEDK